MDERQAVERISQLIEQATRTLDEAEEIAREHKITFRFKGDVFRGHQRWSQWDKWQNSSVECVFDYGHYTQAELDKMIDPLPEEREQYGFPVPEDEDGEE